MYTYYDLQADLKLFEEKGHEVSVIGRSVCGRDIYAVFAGDKSLRPIIVTGGIHARENIGVGVIARHLLRESFQDCAVYFVPMVNPDGNLLCHEGNQTQKFYHEPLDKLKSQGFDFRLFKANYNCVDLNVNFDARFGEGRSNKREADFENYIGPYPESEPETQALVRFTQNVSPLATLSYHAMGREIYWYFYQTDFYQRDYAIARLAAKYTNYDLINGAMDSAGGYKDKCVQSYSIPSLTLELGFGAHPLPDESAEEEYARLKNFPFAFYQSVAGSKKN